MLDLVVAHAKGLAWLDNLRQGRFADRTAASGLAAAGPVEAVASADLDNDGLPDVIAAGNGLTLWRNLGGKFAAWNVPGLPAGKRFTSVIAFDADNDGRLDLAAAGPDGIAILGQRGTLASPTFEPLPVEGAPKDAATLSPPTSTATAISTSWRRAPPGCTAWRTRAATRTTGSTCGCAPWPRGTARTTCRGSAPPLEVRAGTAYQFREAAGPPRPFRPRPPAPGRPAAGGLDQRRAAEPPPAADRSADRGGAGPQGELPVPLRLERRALRLRHRPALELAGRPAGGARRLGRGRTPTSWCGWTAPTGGRRLPPAGHRGALGGRVLRRRPGSGWSITRRGSRWRAACGWCRGSGSR